MILVGHDDSTINIVIVVIIITIINNWTKDRAYYSLYVASGYAEISV